MRGERAAGNRQGSCAHAAAAAAVATGTRACQLTASGPAPLCSFSIDDDTLESTWKVMYVDTILGSGVANPNGCRIPVTW